MCTEIKEGERYRYAFHVNFNILFCYESLKGFSVLFSIGQRHDLAVICCNGVRKLCKSEEANIPSNQMN